MKILVADDHALIRDALRHLLVQLDPSAVVGPLLTMSGLTTVARPID